MGAIVSRVKEKAQIEEPGGSCEVFVVDADRIARARASELGEDDVRDIAETFKVLSNETRVRILRALWQEELCVCDLSKLLGLSMSATSHQLQVLRRARIVRYRMDGKLAYYSPRDPFVLALLDDAVQHVTNGGASA
jgi:DNA-binding transcriptional ArsR family regulator